LPVSGKANSACLANGRPADSQGGDEDGQGAQGGDSASKHRNEHHGWHYIPHVGECKLSTPLPLVPASSAATDQSTEQEGSEESGNPGGD